MHRRAIMPPSESGHRGETPLHEPERDVNEEQNADEERLSVLAQLEGWFERPMWLLAFVWLVLLVVEFTRGTSPLLSGIGAVVWGIFVLEFLLRFLIAPRKLSFVGRNWLTLLALLVPALRLFRVGRVLLVARAGRVYRGARLVRVFGSINRGMRALSASMSRRGLKYVLASTVIVLFVGATGMHAFESGGGSPYSDFGSALWWTAMVLTTMGSDSFPKTAEGRLLCLMLAVYAFAVFGYVTAAIATYFVGRDAQSAEGELVGQTEVVALRQEIAALRSELHNAVLNVRSRSRD